MAAFLFDLTPRMGYVDRQKLLRSGVDEATFVEHRQAQLNASTAVYVGNLSFYTTEDQIYTHFAPCGHIRELVMGLNEVARTPCGFCFLVFESHEAALRAVNELHQTRLDDRLVTVSWDVGCESIRRWGRGAYGGQVVDGIRQNKDDGRGGLGALRRDAAGVSATVSECELVAYTWVEKKPDRHAKTGIKRKR